MGKFVTYMGISNTGKEQHNFLGVSQVSETSFFFLFHCMTCDLVDYLDIFFFLILDYFELFKYCYLKS